MVGITVKDLSGEVHSLEGDEGGALMEPLRDAGLVEATCGGAASCGTCHVFVAPEWVAKTGDRTEDEGYMLEALEEVVEVTDKSRLACQVELSEALDGIELEIAPQV